jgi:hypothetical protein
MWSVASPRAVRIARASATSPAGVEVAWAFRWTTSARSMPPDSTAARMARTTPCPVGSGAAMWWASDVSPAEMTSP